MYSKVLIATDGSDTASVAASRGAAIAQATGASVVLAYIGEEAMGAKVLEAAKDELGVDAELIVAQGDPADKLLEIAEREGADLLVVGNKGMTGAKRFLLGSVPNQISHNANCNVLIVKTT